jgi:hypothetical protein
MTRTNCASRAREILAEDVTPCARGVYARKTFPGPHVRCHKAHARCCRTPAEPERWGRASLSAS